MVEQLRIFCDTSDYYEVLENFNNNYNDEPSVNLTHTLYNKHQISPIILKAEYNLTTHVKKDCHCDILIIEDELKLIFEYAECLNKISPNSKLTLVACTKGKALNYFLRRKLYCENSIKFIIFDYYLKEKVEILMGESNVDFLEAVEINVENRYNKIKEYLKSNYYVLGYTRFDYRDTLSEFEKKLRNEGHQTRPKRKEDLCTDIRIGYQTAIEKFNLSQVKTNNVTSKIVSPILNSSSTKYSLQTAKKFLLQLEKGLKLFFDENEPDLSGKYNWKQLDGYILKIDGTPYKSFKSSFSPGEKGGHFLQIIQDSTLNFPNLLKAIECDFHRGKIWYDIEKAIRNKKSAT